MFERLFNSYRYLPPRVRLAAWIAAGVVVVLAAALILLTSGSSNAEAKVGYTLEDEPPRVLSRAAALDEASRVAGLDVTGPTFPAGLELVAVDVNPPDPLVSYGPTIVTMDFLNREESLPRSRQIAVQLATTRIQLDTGGEPFDIGVSGVEASVGTSQAGVRVYSLVAEDRSWLVMVSGADRPTDDDMRPALVDLVTRD